MLPFFEELESVILDFVATAIWFSRVREFNVQQQAIEPEFQALTQDHQR